MIKYNFGSKKKGFQAEDYVHFAAHRTKKKEKKKNWMKTSEFEPRMCSDGLFASISIVVEKLLPCFDVSRSHQD